MKGFLVGLLLGLSLAAWPSFAGRDIDESWQAQQQREAMENPMDQHGNMYTNQGGSLTPSFSEQTRRGPC